MAVDPHAFKSLWPALGIWLAVFLAAGGGSILCRQAALRLGAPASAVVVAVRGRRVTLEYGGARTGQFVSLRSGELRRGRLVPVHLVPRTNWAYLDDDRGYSRWKLWVFGAAFVGLWVWAAARYRFG